MYDLNKLYKNTDMSPEMVMVAFSRFLVDFRVQWQNVIEDEINSLLNRQS